MSIEKVSAAMSRLPPPWMKRVESTGGNIGNANEIKKMMGEPIPRLANQGEIPKEVAEMFEPSGMLERLRKKLALISRKKGKKFIPAHGVVASVDEEDNVYVGVEFLQQFGNNEALVAAILAHEWGHMMSDLPRGKDWSHLNWEQIFEIRRDEEADADGFAGRALFLMGFTPDEMIQFLETLHKIKKNKRELPCRKYHNTATRVAILEEAYAAEKRAMEVARKLFFASRETGPKIGRVISSG
ncbi:MAG: hypothetical protein ABH859_05405 [Pseudomonadota bacterium]